MRRCGCEICLCVEPFYRCEMLDDAAGEFCGFCMVQLRESGKADEVFFSPKPSSKVYASRPDWHSYFISIAQAVAARADCRRAKHGAVLVKDRRICSTGYNSYPAGRGSCLQGDCPRGLLSYDELPSLTSYDEPGPAFCGAIHAESNSLLYASREQTEGATLYVTGIPCGGCKKLMLGAGVSLLVYLKDGEIVVEEL